jgi:ABC-type sugar transport system ATPase subunit
MPPRHFGPARHQARRAQPARGLTLAAQQAVEIAKAISLDTRVLIMDEPTASLSAHEVEQLFKLTRRLRSRAWPFCSSATGWKRCFRFRIA